MQNGLNDAPVLAHEPVRTKSISFYEPRFAPNFRTNHNDVRRPRDKTLSVVVQRAVNNLAERLCSSKISGLGVEAPWHCLDHRSLDAAPEWAAPPVKAQSICKFGVCDCLGKNNIRKISQEKTPDIPTRNVGERPYLLVRAHRISLTFIARLNFRRCCWNSNVLQSRICVKQSYNCSSGK